MVETTYADRLALAMGAPAGERPNSQRMHELAAQLQISYQAVAKYFRDGSKSMTAENNSRAARWLRVDPDWLATGEGEMRSSRVWPFGSEITPAEFFTLEESDVRPAIVVLRDAIQRRAAAVTSGSGGKPSALAA